MSRRCDRDGSIGHKDVDLTFEPAWAAEVLPRRPLILPPRHFTYPRDAEEVERGALELMISPRTGDRFLATFALGFADPSLPTGLWACPNPDELCAASGGYAYVIDTRDPSTFTQIPLRPVFEVRAIGSHHLLLFVGSQTLIAWGREGQAWHSPRLSSEGLRLTGIGGDRLHGCGWDLFTDREVPFVLDLRTGQPCAQELST